MTAAAAERLEQLRRHMPRATAELLDDVVALLEADDPAAAITAAQVLRAKAEHTRAVVAVHDGLEALHRRSLVAGIQAEREQEAQRWTPPPEAAPRELTDADRDEIRRLADDPANTRRQIGERFGVSATTVTRIARGRR